MKVLNQKNFPVNNLEDRYNTIPYNPIWSGEKGLISWGTISPDDIKYSAVFSRPSSSMLDHKSQDAVFGWLVGCGAVGGRRRGKVHYLS